MVGGGLSRDNLDDLMMLMILLLSRRHIDTKHAVWMMARGDLTRPDALQISALPPSFLRLQPAWSMIVLPDYLSP